MRPDSSTTRTPSSMVLNKVSRKLRSRASRWMTVCKPSVSRRPIRPSTLSRKLDLREGTNITACQVPSAKCQVPSVGCHGGHGSRFHVSRITYHVSRITYHVYGLKPFFLLKVPI